MTFFTVSSCRDLLFHVQEHRFTLPEIASLIDANDMSFIGFDFDGREIPNAFGARFGDDRLGDLVSWRAFETAHPDLLEGYVFWCQKL